MYLIRPSFEILTKINGEEILKNIERAARTCYDSNDKTTQDSYKSICKNIIQNQHFSCIEHENISVKFIVDRGVLMELSRHRLASYSVSSTRYINHSKKGITFIIPPWITDIREGEWTNKDVQDYFDKTNWAEDNQNEVTKCLWITQIYHAADCYNTLIKYKWTPQQARAVLPNSLKTEIIMTCNLRELRHIFNLRCSPKSHPQMVEIMARLQNKLREKIPIIFDDI